MHLSRIFPLVVLSLSAAVVPAWSQIVGPLTFDSAADLTDNFRNIQLPGSTGQVTVATDGGNSYLDVAAGTSSIAWVAAYDTTPAVAGDAHQTFSGDFTVSFGISSAHANASFGFYLVDPLNSGNNLLTLFNLDSTAGTAGNEQIRFWRDTANLTAGDTGTIYASGISGTEGSFHFPTNSWITSASVAGNVVASATSPYTFYPVSFTYSPSSSQLTVTQGSFSSTLAIPAADVIANPRLLLRVNDPSLAAGSVKIDNFTVTTIPEPASAVLAGLSALGLGMMRRRRRG